jgi:hypothetical protein
MSRGWLVVSSPNLPGKSDAALRAEKTMDCRMKRNPAYNLTTLNILFIPSNRFFPVDLAFAADARSGAVEDPGGELGSAT